MSETDSTYAWRVRATAASHRLDFSSDLVNEAAGLLAVAMGEEWLSSITGLRTFPNIGIQPLGDALAVPGDEGVLLILEIAHYLKTLAATPGLQQVISSLRTQHHQTLLQLAMGYRALAMGVNNLEFEPQSTKGRLADLGLTLGGHHYLIECYRPTVSGRPENHMADLLKSLGLCLPTRGVPVALAIQLKKPLDHRVRKNVVYSARRTVGDLAETSFHSAILHDDDDALISAAPTKTAPAGGDSLLMLHPEFPRLPNRDSQFIRVGLATSDATRLVDAPQAFPTHSCAAVWPHAVPARTPDPDASFARLVKKVKRKLAQTRSDAAATRVVIVDSWVTESIDKLPFDARDYVRNEVLRQHSGSISIIFVRRRNDPAVRRRRYVYRAFAGEDDRTAAVLAEMLSAWEATNVVPQRVAS
jgi:hypothetical protein